ncbi:MAG TPA: type II toxin-antitoxin system RelE/ParE family toxin [Mucilaginibacter sp.]
MSLAILWSDDAKDTFDIIVSFIESEWGESSSKKFVTHTNKILKLISDQPYMYKSSFSIDVRQAFISPQTSLYYEIHQESIMILFFWDNRQEPIL